MEPKLPKCRRGVSASRDGQIHTDSRTKLITVLIYMNNAWEAKTGRLRLLRGPDNLEDVIAEVPPDEGTMLIFKNGKLIDQLVGLQPKPAIEARLCADRVFAAKVARVTDTVVPCRPAKVSTCAPSCCASALTILVPNPVFT